MAYRGVPQGMVAPGYEGMSVNGGSRRRSGETRFTPNYFQYNVRIAIALVPSAILLLGVGGKPVLAVLTVGLMISYILDLLQLNMGAFVGTWGTLFAVVVALLFNGTSFTSATSGSLVLYVLTLFVSYLLLFLIGVWVSLQFRWFQLENPTVVLALERLLFACTPVIAATIQTWGVASAVGMTHAHYYLMLILFEVYWLFSLPHPSSFMQKTERNYGGKIVEEALIAGPLEGAFHMLLLLFLPLFFYIGGHHARLFTSIYSLCDMLLLFFVPLLFLMFASSRGSLWWLARDSKDLDQFRLVNGGIAVVIIILCLEIRVIFHSFGQYIYIAPPWNYFLVTIALFGAAGAAGAFLSGAITDTMGFFVLTSLLQVAAVCGSFVLGLPYKFFPASISAAYYLSYFSSKKSVWSYFIFVISASIPASWFVVHNFYYLNVWLGGVNVQLVCKLIMGSIFLGLVNPGLSLLPSRVQVLLSLGLIGQAVVLCTAENRLYNYTNMYYFGIEDDAVYPSYLVVLTSVVGMALTRRLLAEKRIGSWAAWVLFCLYAAKLSMLVVTARNVLWASIVLLLAISPPLAFYKDRGKGVSRMKVWQGLLHAGVVLVAVWLCRNTIFEVLQWATGRPPSDGLLLGVLIFCIGLSSAPIVTQHFPHVQLAKSSMVLVVTLGICLIYLDPPLPRGWILSQYRRTQWSNNPDSLPIYGTSESSQPTWPSWLLIITILTSLAAFTSALPIQHFVELRLFYAVGVGASGGIYLCAQYFYQAPLLHALLVGAVICASVFLVFTHLPSASSPRFLPWVFALLVALLPLMYLVEGQVRASGEGEDDKFVTSLAIEGGRMSLLGLYAAILMMIALEIKLQLATIIRDKASNRPAGRSKVLGGSRPRLIPQQRRPTITNSFGVKKLAAEGAWMPAIGNVATLLCFALCLVLNVHLNGGSEHAVFLIAPILLLLNQDANLLTGFGDQQRYFPITAVVSVYLILSGSYRLWEEVWHGYQNSGWGLETGGPGLFYAVKNALMLILTIPNHAIFNRFMWDYAQQSDFVLLLISPLNVPAAIITDISSIRALSLLGIAYAVAQYSVSRHIRIQGMKFI